MATIALQDGKVVLKDGKASCTCCGEVICPGGVKPKNPPSDPDFSKKLVGDPSVTPFTQVSIDYQIGSANGGSISGSHYGQWIPPTSCPPQTPYIRVADFNCSSWDGCGISSICDVVFSPQFAVGDLFLALLNENCIILQVTEQVIVAIFGASETGTGGPTITINGVSYSSYTDPGPFGGSVFGYANLTFS